MSVNDRHRKYPNRLTVVRNGMGYSQKQVIKMLGLTRIALLSEWENGKTMPSGVYLIKLCVLYKKTTRELYPLYYQQVAQRIRPL